MPVITIVVAGKVDCPMFAHVDYVADYLQRCLPSFHYTRIVKRTEDWNQWLLNTVEEYEWQHLESPLIWTQYGLPGITLDTKPHYMGGASEFWEYCCEYYNLYSVLTPPELDMLVCDNLKRLCHDENMEMDYLQSARRRRVVIMGANHDITPLLVTELLNHSAIALSEPTEVLLFDVQSTIEELNEFAEFLDPSPPEYGEYGINRRVKSANMFDTSFLATCHIIIVLVGSDRYPDESEDSWMLRNRIEMSYLSERLNSQAAHDVRVVFAVCNGVGPVMFNAGLVAADAKKYRSRNVVVATASLALNALPVLSEIAGVSMFDMSLPPVWGDAGSPACGGGFIDCQHAMHHFVRFNPNARAAHAKPGSTLPLGVYEPDRRKIEYLLHAVPNLYRHIVHYSFSNPEQVNANAVTAISDLLRFWFGKYNGEIISLGVVSDGTFGLPNGLMFSQQVTLDSGDWLPYEDTSLPSLDASITLQDLVSLHQNVEKLYMKQTDEESHVEEEEVKRLKAPNYCSLRDPSLLKD